jgi:hypothetical protein
MDAYDATAPEYKTVYTWGNIAWQEKQYGNKFNTNFTTASHLHFLSF